VFHFHSTSQPIPNACCIVSRENSQLNFRCTMRVASSNLQAELSVSPTLCQYVRLRGRTVAVTVQRQILACSACSAEQGPPQKGSPKATECRTAARHFLACCAFLWRVATCKSSLAAARHSVACGGLCTPTILNFTTSRIYSFPGQKFYMRAPTFLAIKA